METHFKCLHTDEHNLGNKQEKLKICMWSQSYGTTKITETLYIRRVV